VFEPWIMRFWARFKQLGLGFVERGEERTNGRKRKSKTSEWTGLDPLLYKQANRVDPNPVRSPSLSFVGSWSYWIRINPTPQRRSGDPDPSVSLGSGFLPAGFVLLSVFLNFLAMCTPVLAIWTSCVFWFLYKIPKNCYAFLVCFLPFCDVFTYSRLMEIVRVNFTFDSYILCVLVWIFSCNVWSETCHVMLMFGI